MDLIFLGTSSGAPTRTRNVSAVALLEDTGRAWYLVDCGEATQHQILRTPLSLHELRAIFITHVHGDHCYGLPGLLASAAMTGRRAALDIIAPAGIEEWLAATFRLTQGRLPYPITFHRTETLQGWRSPAVRVEAAELSHRVPSYAYAFTEARPDVRLNIARLDAEGIPRGPLWGQLARGVDVEYGGRLLSSDAFLIPGRAPRRVVIGGDNDHPELLDKLCEGAQILVHEATYTQAVAERGRSDYGHSTARSVAEFAERRGLPNLILTHFSARYQNNPAINPSIDDIRREAKAHYRGQLFLAADLERYQLNREGSLRLL